MSRRFVVKQCAISVGVTLLLLALAGANEASHNGHGLENHVPATLWSEVRKVSPSARIVVPSQIDIASCGPQTEPGLVSADFNGDGSTDYALLLRTGRTRTIREGRGRDKSELSELILVVFTAADSRWQRVLTNRFWVPSPTASRYVIKLQPPGTLRGIGSEKKVTLANPGIVLVYCEAIATVYYWSGKKRAFESVVTSE
jgi:hypothetical protein